MRLFGPFPKKQVATLIDDADGYGDIQFLRLRFRGSDHDFDIGEIQILLVWKIAGEGCHRCKKDCCQESIHEFLRKIAFPIYQSSSIIFSRQISLNMALARYLFSTQVRGIGSIRTVVFRFAVVDDLVAFGDLEEFGIRFGGRESGDGEDLFAAGGAVYLGDEIEGEMRGYQDSRVLTRGWSVSHDSGVEGQDVAVAHDIFAADVAGPEIFMLTEAFAVGRGPLAAKEGL